MLCGWSFKKENDFTGQWWFCSKGGTFDNVIEAIRFVECESFNLDYELHKNLTVLRSGVSINYFQPVKIVCTPTKWYAFTSHMDEF